MRNQDTHQSEQKLIEHLRILSIKDEHKHALKVLKRYLRMHKEPSISLRLKEAFMLYHIGRNTEAVKIYKRILLDNKDTLNALIFLSRTYAGMKKQEAVSLAKTAYAISPNLVTANNLANIFDMLGLWKEAERIYRQALKYAIKQEDKFIVNANRALCYARQKKRKDAIQIAQKLLKNKNVRKEKFALAVKMLKEIFNESKRNRKTLLTK